MNWLHVILLLENGEGLGRFRAGLVSGVSVLVLFVALFGVVLNVPVVKGGSGTIYIRADGSIDPPDAPISTVDNVTYTLIDNVYETIMVERSNIIIDGNGYTLQGSGSGDGFYLSDINNVTITRTNIKGFSPLWYGIIVTRSFNISICGNNIMNNSHYGIGLFASHNNICDNNITDNDRGIGLYSSHNNFVVGNNFANNVYGIRLGDSSDNIFYHNNFINNEVQVYDEDIPKSINAWDNGYPSGGNYWSDYNSTDLLNGLYQNETGTDNIGDTPYTIDANNVDNYPLIHPYVPFEHQTIYVRADGSVDPSGAPILRKGGLYFLTGNINSDADGIVVEKDNIVVEGSDFTVEGREDGFSHGTILSGRSNVTIQNTNIKNFGYGIYLDSSSDNSIVGNNMTDNGEAIELDKSSNNTIVENNITNNADTGIWLDESSNNNVVGNNIENNTNGIELGRSSNCNKINENSITASESHAILLCYSSSNNDVVENNITASKEYGIRLYKSSNNSISRNIITDSYYLGINLYSSSNNSINGNTITNNSIGILLGSSSDNTFCHNNLINNTAQVDDLTPEQANLWDNGCEGNYWSDYNGTDANHDGIGDSNYTIDADNNDKCPLMGMFTEFNTTSEQHVQTICNSTISDFQFNGTAISFNVSGENDTTGFCRICIPTALMHTTYKVFVSGTEVSYNLLSCSNESHSYLYFNYTHSTQEVIIIPEFSSFLILPLFMIATLLAVIVYKRKHPV
jgi:parallel beta-helix repeat protein